MTAGDRYYYQSNLPARNYIKFNNLKKKNIYISYYQVVLSTKFLVQVELFTLLVAFRQLT